MMSFDVAVVHIEKIILKEVSMGGDGRQYSFEVSSKTHQRRLVSKLTFHLKEA